MNQIIRYHECELRAEESDGKRTIAGHAAVFYDGTPETELDVHGMFVERVMRGAFDRVIEERQDVRALVNHDPGQLLGRLSAGTLQLRVDDVGLFYSIDVADTQLGRDTWTAVRRRDYQGNSIGFESKGEKHRRDGTKHVRELWDMDLLDVGPVTFPAFESTDVQAYSLQDAQRWMAEHKPAQGKLSVRVRHELMTRKRQTN